MCTRHGRPRKVESTASEITDHLDRIGVDGDREVVCAHGQCRTPGLADPVTITCGIAYVADSSAGLTVVNYRAFDTAGQAPTVALSSNFPLGAGAVESHAELFGHG